MLSLILTFSIPLLILFSVLNGTSAQAGASLMEGAKESLRFLAGIAGGLCLWSAILELAERCGLSDRLGRLLHPILRKLFPLSAEKPEILTALSENVSANLLGLGNAATPAGVRAAKGMARLGEKAEDELSLFVVINTASLQLFPGMTTALLSAAGSSAPYDILPAVWISTAVSLCAGLGAASFFRRIWPSSR